MPVCNHNLEPGKSKDNFEWVGRRDKGDNFKVYERKLSFLHFEPPVLLIIPEQQTDLKPENRQGRIFGKGEKRALLPLHRCFVYLY